MALMGRFAFHILPAFALGFTVYRMPLWFNNARVWKSSIAGEGGMQLKRAAFTGACAALQQEMQK